MAKFKLFLLRALNTAQTVYANLTPSQRRKLYTLATALGVAVAAKLGIEADTLFEWVVFAATVASAVVGPAFAKSKVTDE